FRVTGVLTCALPISTGAVTSPQVPVTAPVGQGFVSIDAGTGHSTLVVEATDATAVNVEPVLQDVLWWTVSGLGLALDLYGFAEEDRKSGRQGRSAAR